MSYLLDTNVWIDIERGREAQVSAAASSCLSNELWLSTIVIGEIQSGIQRSRNPELARRVYDLPLQGRPRVGVDEQCAQVYGELRAGLLDSGRMIGGNDLWIAAQAVRNDLTLITANTGEFPRIPGLRLENWREDQHRG